MEPLITRQALMEIADLIVQNSGGRAILAYQEEDKTQKKASDAAHFLKVDGQRIGRDIELYGFLGDGPAGWQMTLAMFLEEIILPVKTLNLTESYKVAGERLKRVGQDIYSAGMLRQWNELF